MAKEPLEILSLTDDALDVEELERRLELAPLAGPMAPGPGSPGEPGGGDTCDEQLASWCCGGQNSCESQCAFIKVK
jgi:hypothetical protein